MYGKLSCIIVDPDAANRQEMYDFLASRGIRVLTQLTSPVGLEHVLASPDPPQMAVINLDPAPRDKLDEIGPLIRQFPAVRFFVLSQVLDPILVMDAMQAGAWQFVPLPIDQINESRFLAAIDRVVEIDIARHKARIIHVIPAAGGCGASTVACNVAISLARSGRAMLMDLDLVGGTVAEALCLRPCHTIADLMQRADDLDENMVRNALEIHRPSGVAVLARPHCPEEACRITQVSLAHLLAVLSRTFDYIVVDSRMDLSPIYTAVIQAADLNVLVMQLNLPSVRNAVRYVESLRRNGVDQSRIRIIINRFVKHGAEIDPGQIEGIGLPVHWCIPNDSKSIVSALNYGQPVILHAPRAEISQNLGRLAASLNGRSHS